jgi:CTP synthase
LGEQKSKPAQLNMKSLMSTGVMPHIIACRASRPVNKKVREKLAMYSNVPMDRVFSMHDIESVYLIPEALRGGGIDTTVMQVLHLVPPHDHKAEDEARAKWMNYMQRFRASATPITIGITGKYTSLRDSYASIIQALEHAGSHWGAKVRIEWIDSTDLRLTELPKLLEHVHGVIVPGGFGVRGVEGKIATVQHCREKLIPYLGLCYGFQIAVVEFARNVCGMEGASSTEIDHDTPHAVIDILPEQKRIEGLGGNMRLGGHDVAVKAGTQFAELHGNAERVRLRFRHRYEVNPQYIPKLEAAGMVFSGKATNHPIMQVLELPRSMHPFFMGTQAHAELTSRPLRPDPFFLGLVRAAMIRSGAADPMLANPQAAAAPNEWSHAGAE